MLIFPQIKHVGIKITIRERFLMQLCYALEWSIQMFKNFILKNSKIGVKLTYTGDVLTEIHGKSVHMCLTYRDNSKPGIGLVGL